MKTTITDMPSGGVTLRVEMDAQDLREHILHAQQELGGEITVEGFRKGKAPQEILQQRLNPAAVREHALEHALEESFTAVAKEQNWDIAKTEKLSVEENSADRLVYSVSVLLYPNVELPDLSGVRVPRQQVTVSDQELSEALESVRSMRSTFHDKNDAAAEGDRVEVDFSVSHDGKPIEGGESKNHPLVIGGKGFIPGFEDQLVGMRAGEEKKFSLDAPKDYYHPDIAGKHLDFTVTMQKVQSVERPELNDAFAQSLGQFTSLQELSERTRGGLMHEKEEKERQRVRVMILDEIAKKLTVALPAFLVEDELSEMVERFSRDLASRGMQLGMYLASVKKTEEELRASWRADAERQVRFALILRAVARQQKISVPSSAIDAMMEDVLREATSRGGALPEGANPEAMRQAIAQKLLSDQTMQWLEQTYSA